MEKNKRWLQLFVRDVLRMRSRGAMQTAVFFVNEFGEFELGMVDDVVKFSKRFDEADFVEKRRGNERRDHTGEDFEPEGGVDDVEGVEIGRVFLIPNIVELSDPSEIRTLEAAESSVEIDEDIVAIDNRIHESEDVEKHAFHLGEVVGSRELGADKHDDRFSG